MLPFLRVFIIYIHRRRGRTMGAKIEISRKASNTIQRIGLSYECVTQAVQSPDDIQKIMPSTNDQHDWPVISLYMKRLSNTNEESLLIVQALKQGGVVTAGAVWQVYPDDIGISKSARVLAVF